MYRSDHAAPGRTPQRRIVFHGHDTWGLGVANTLAAIAAGATMVDGALGGLGGCPFAPGASGNTSTEDLLFATRPDWLTPTTLASLVELSEKLLAELGEPNRSRTAQGARSKATAFEWVIGSGDPMSLAARLAFLSPTRSPNPLSARCAPLAASTYPPKRTPDPELRVRDYDVVVSQLRDTFDTLLDALAKCRDLQLRGRVQQRRHGAATALDTRRQHTRCAHRRHRRRRDAADHSHRPPRRGGRHVRPRRTVHRMGTVSAPRPGRFGARSVSPDSAASRARPRNAPAFGMSVSFCTRQRRGSSSTR